MAETIHATTQSQTQSEEGNALDARTARRPVSWPGGAEDPRFIKHTLKLLMVTTSTKVGITQIYVINNL